MIAMTRPLTASFHYILVLAQMSGFFPAISLKVANYANF